MEKIMMVVLKKTEQVLRDIGLLGRVNKKYLPKQYHHGIQVNWEAVGGLMGGKIKKEDTTDSEGSQLGSG